MAVKGSATVTISQYRDTESVTRYYKLQSSSLAAPDKPANVKPNETPAGWSKAEPACDITKTLYTCDVTVFSDKTTHVSDVSKSTSYEAAKEAWNKAQTAQNTATEAAKTADNYISTDSTGIMVSENKGATKETPSNATKNNVLITEKDVQIRKGKNVVASYGETTTIGDKFTGDYVEIEQGGTTIINGGKEVAKLQKDKITFGDVGGYNACIGNRSFELKSGATLAFGVLVGVKSKTVTTTFDIDGKVIESLVENGKEYSTFIPLESPTSIYKIKAGGGGPSEVDLRRCIEIVQDGVNVKITKDKPANVYPYWSYYNKITIEYSSGTVEGHATCDWLYAKELRTASPDGTKLSIVDLIYPVGSIYMSVNAANPETLFGGTWQQIKDRFLLSAGDTYTAGSTGGSAKATLPSHTHTVGSGGYQLWGAKSGKGSTEPGNQISGNAKYYAAATGGSTSNYKWLGSVDSKGVSDVSQANMPPYLAVYVWQRIS